MSRGELLRIAGYSLLSALIWSALIILVCGIVSANELRREGQTPADVATMVRNLPTIQASIVSIRRQRQSQAVRWPG